MTRRLATGDGTGFGVSARVRLDFAEGATEKELRKAARAAVAEAVAAALQPAQEVLRDCG